LAAASDAVSVLPRDEPSSLLAELLTAPIVTFDGAPQAVTGELWDAEREAVANCTPVRVLQHGATRRLARRALEVLGVPAAPLLNRADRSPIWPAHVVGSLTHTRGYCGVAVVHAQHLRGMGIDAEWDTPLKEATLRRVLVDEEVEHLKSAAKRSAHPFASLGKLVFSAKECVHKCVYPQTKLVLGFQEVALEFDWHTSTFQVHFLHHAELARYATHLEGKFLHVRGLWLTTLTWRH
jgi:4'-phosphopantetheinyl transferase EntD